jgi:hypothetical protein
MLLLFPPLLGGEKKECCWSSCSTHVDKDNQEEESSPRTNLQIARLEYQDTDQVPLIYDQQIFLKAQNQPDLAFLTKHSKNSD